MKSVWKHLQAGFLVLLAFMLLSGCGASKGVVYEMTEPTPEPVGIKGLSSDDQIVEMVDYANGKAAERNQLLVVVKRDREYHLGSLDFTSGTVSNLTPLQQYDPQHPLYWQKLEEEELSGLGKCWGTCMSATAIGGTTEKYGFYAEKEFWGDKDHKVTISYQFKKEEETRSGWYTSTTYTTTQAKATEKFIMGDKVEEANQVSGYWGNFRSNGNVRKARYYPVGSEDYYFGAQPDLPEQSEFVRFFVYYPNNNNMSGAQADYRSSKPYVDAGVIRSGALVGIIVGKPGEYMLKRFSAPDFAKAIKLHRAVQD